MIPKTTILSDNITELLEMYNNLPLPLAKLKFREDYYKEKLYKKTIFENDDKICLTDTKFTILYNTKFFAKPTANQGLSYDKKTRKLKVWFGTKLINLPLLSLFRYLGITWVDKMNEYENYNGISLNNLIKTKSIVEKIISGKITNPKDLIRQFIKTSIKYKYDWNILCKFLNHYNSGDSNSLTTFLIIISKFTVNPNESLKIISHLKNYDKKLSGIVRNHGQITDGFWDDFPIEGLKEINDVSSALNSLRAHKNNLMNLLNYASFLETKVSFKWSPKRVKYESTRINNILLDYEGLSKDETEREFIGDIILPDNCRLIKSESDLFKSLRSCKIKTLIGNEHQYCYLWTNKHYYFINFSLPCNIVCVVRQNKNNGNVIVENVIGLSDDNIKLQIRNIVTTWLSAQEVKVFFTANKVNEITEVTREADMMGLF